MGGHASLVSKKEIWTLVHYIRKFQNSAYGTFNADGSSVATSTATSADSTKAVAPKKPN